jgi:hypothetical protein
MLDDSPVARLESCEKPRWKPGRVGILEGDDLARVLATRATTPGTRPPPGGLILPFVALALRLLLAPATGKHNHLGEYFRPKSIHLGGSSQSGSLTATSGIRQASSSSSGRWG